MTEENQFTDEYFINLTMDYDKRDDDIYPKWAVWCAKSDDKYYIDGKDGHFYTHVRTNEEIAIEQKKRELMEFVMNQDRPVDEEGNIAEDWMEYERYIHDLIMDEENILTAEAPMYKQWKNAQTDESTSK